MRHGRGSMTMRNDGNGSGDDERLTARGAFVATLGAVLFLPPLLSAAARGSEFLGLPTVWVYLFAVWAGLIGLVAVLVRRSG